jgi:hypothetical protein
VLVPFTNIILAIFSSNKRFSLSISVILPIIKGQMKF